MTIEGVALDVNQLTVVVLRERDGTRLLPIWIGPNEARAIQTELEGAHPPRPMSHDLMISLVLALGGRLNRVVITDLVDSTFHAQLEVETARGLKIIDARPSDAIALAVRAKCPIFVSGSATEAFVSEQNDDESPEFEAQSNPENAGSNGSREAIYADENSDEVARFKRLLGEE